MRFMVLLMEVEWRLSASSSEENSSAANANSSAP
jgi:hypothetical protein